MSDAITAQRKSSNASRNTPVGRPPQYYINSFRRRPPPHGRLLCTKKERTTTTIKRNVINYMKGLSELPFAIKAESKEDDQIV